MVQVIFNSNYEDQGQRNARTLEWIIEGALSERLAGVILGGN